jgi:hypothetical protein
VLVSLEHIWVWTGIQAREEDGVGLMSPGSQVGMLQGLEAVGLKQTETEHSSVDIVTVHYSHYLFSKR